MRECEPQRAKAAHRKTSHSSGSAVTDDVILRLDVRQELGKQEIVVAILTICRVDEETSSPFGCNQQKIADFLFPAEVLDQSPAATAQQRLFSLAQPVQKIKHRIFLAALLFITRREHDAIPHRPMQNAALEAAAINPALRGERRGNQNDNDGEHKKAAEAFQVRRDFLSVTSCPWWLTLFGS